MDSRKASNLKLCLNAMIRYDSSSVSCLTYKDCFFSKYVFHKRNHIHTENIISYLKMCNLQKLYLLPVIRGNLSGATFQSTSVSGGDNLCLPINQSAHQIILSAERKLFMLPAVPRRHFLISGFILVNFKFIFLKKLGLLNIHFPSPSY